MSIENKLRANFIKTMKNEFDVDMRKEIKEHQISALPPKYETK